MQMNGMTNKFHDCFSWFFDINILQRTPV